MRDYFTADLHLGHEVVARHRGYTVTAHDNLIIGNLRQTLKEQDRLFILGDLSVGEHGESHALSLLGAVRQETGCEMHLIAGNHDSVHPMSSRAHRQHEGFRLVFDSIASMGTLKLAGTRALMHHMPYEGDHTKEDRFVEYRAPNHGMPIIHGHTHSEVPVTWATGDVPQICVSLDAWRMRPVTKEALTRIINGPTGNN